MKGFNFSNYTQQTLDRATTLAIEEQSPAVSVHHLMLVLLRIFPGRVPAGELSRWQKAFERAMYSLGKTSIGTTLQYDDLLKKAFNRADRFRIRERETLIHPKHLWEVMVGKEKPLIDIKELVRESETPDTKDKQQQDAEQKEIPEGSILSKICTNFTQKARLGALEPVIGRDKEIAQVIRVLLKRKKNNPLLLGEAGVGKTAIIEGIAQKLVESEDIALFRSLKDKEILGLDLISLIGGTGVRGELEKRLNELIQELEKSANRYILFIDEVHNLMGAGKSEGSADLANYLKPALARGEISVIGATTFAEYKRFIETDAALKRRFESIFVSEPTLEETKVILQNIQSLNEEFHNVTYEEEVVDRIPVWATNYFSETHRPDSAINLMDNLGAYSAQKNLESDKTANITLQIAAEFVQETKGIDPQYLLMGANQRIVNLKKVLTPSFKGQESALEELFQSLATWGIQGYPRKPLTAMIFTGTARSEKLNIAQILTEYLYPEENKIYSLDLAAYTERESLYNLIGPPRGIEGFQDGGELTEFVKRNPQCCLILNNAEHCHPNVLRIFMDPLRKGYITDSARISYPFHQAMVIILVDSLDRFRMKNGDEFIQLAQDSIEFTIPNPQLRLSLIQDAVKEAVDIFVSTGYELDIDAKICEMIDKELAKQDLPSRNAIKDKVRTYFENPLAAFIIEEMTEPGKVKVAIEEEKICFAKA